MIKNGAKRTRSKHTKQQPDDNNTKLPINNITWMAPQLNEHPAHWPQRTLENAACVGLTPEAPEHTMPCLNTDGDGSLDRINNLRIH